MGKQPPTNRVNSGRISSSSIPKLKYHSAEQVFEAEIVPPIANPVQKDSEWDQPDVENVKGDGHDYGTTIEMTNMNRSNSSGIVNTFDSSLNFTGGNSSTIDLDRAISLSNVIVVDAPSRTPRVNSLYPNISL